MAKQKKPKRRDSFDIYWTLGEKIRLARLASGLTGKEIGMHLGISEQQALKYERCEARIPLDRLILIADATGMPIEYFLGDYESGAEPSWRDIGAALELVRSTGDLVSLWHRVPTSERSHLLAVIRNAAEG